MFFSIRSLLFLALCCVVAPVFGQSAAAGALEGSITDLAGMQVADVAVQLHNGATGESLTVRSGPDGAFRFSLVPAGTYDVTFARDGFKTSRMAGLTLNSSEVPLLDAKLEPGDSAAAPSECACVLRASAPSTGTLVDEKTITSVPLNTRNFTQVLSMTSGSVATVNNAGTLGRGTPSVNVNGNTTAGGYTVDGAYAPSTVPNPDTISEFKIPVSQNDAMFGAMVPTTNLMTKRGENTVHGNLWEFLRNDVFNANAFFRNATGQSKPNLKQNQFGATLGGPVRRNKLFFFTSYQGTRQVNGLDPTSVSNLILPGLTDDRSASTLAAQFCPAGNGNGSRYQSYAGGRQLDCHNQSTSTTAPINPVALRLLQMKGSDGRYLIPTPQTMLTSGPNAGLGFSSYSLPSTYNEHHGLGNIDGVFATKHTVSGRMFASTVDQLRTFGSPGGYPGAPVVPGFGAPQKLKATDVATSLRMTSQLTANLVNEGSMTYTRNRTDAVGVGIPAASTFGVTAVDPLFPVAPEITVLGPMGSFRLFGTNPNDNHFETRTFSWSDNVSWIHGSQRLRVGGYFLNQYNGRADTGGARGRVSFQTFEDFLLGLNAADNLSPAGRSNIQSVQANEGIGPNGEVEYRYRRYYGAAFVQDDIKFSPRFTLNLGVRWEYIGPSFDEAGAIGNVSLDLLRKSPIPPAGGTLAGNTVAANYDPQLINPYTGKPFGPPPAGVVTRASKSFYENGTPLDKFAPRVGFAWQPLRSSNRLVLGGAYSWFLQSPLFSANAATAPLFTQAPFAQGFTNAESSNGASHFAAPFPLTTLGYVPRTLTSQLSDRVAGPEYRIPRLQQWSFTAKWKIAQNLSLDLGYIGSRGDHLLLSRVLNQPSLASAATPLNCGYDGDPSHCMTTNTAANARQRVPILGETPTALATSEFTGGSWYHSAQATLRKQVSRGLTFQAAYTYSKALNNLNVFNDQFNLDLSKARAAFDRTHRLITNFDYQLPLPALGSSGFGRAVTQGWSVTGIVLLQTGMPVTLTDPNGGTVFGRAATSTVSMCPGATYGSLATSGSVNERLGRWFDTSAICSPAILGSDGTAAGYGTAGQNILNGPSQVNSDFSIGKRTRVGGLRENGELTFRVEFYNAMNHSQFSNPGTTFRTAAFGVITQTAVAPRLIQFGVKYLF